MVPETVCIICELIATHKIIDYHCSLFILILPPTSCYQTLCTNTLWERWEEEEDTNCGPSKVEIDAKTIP